MAKITVFMELPSIANYYEGDEDVHSTFVGTFEQGKKQIEKALTAYLERLNKLTYQDWKKTHEV